MVCGRIHYAWKESNAHQEVTCHWVGWSRVREARSRVRIKPRSDQESTGQKAGWVKLVPVGSASEGRLELNCLPVL